MEPDLLNWVEIDARAIHWNVAQFRRRLGPDVLLGAVVKSDAYGHGMLEVAALACEAGGLDFESFVARAVELALAEPRAPSGGVGSPTTLA